MKILVVSQYFWPENFRINDLCVSLHDRGHDVTVLTAKPNYPDGKFFDEYIHNPDNFNTLNGIDIIRSPILARKKGGLNLLLNYISFVFSGSLTGMTKLKNKEFDVIFVCQLSPVTAAIPAIFMKHLRKVPIVMWSLDLWPESLQSVGVIKSQKVLNLVGSLVSWIYNRCDIILGQSNSYLEAIKTRTDSSTALKLFPNWAEDQFSIKKEIKVKKSYFNILFAGNIGDAQDFESIVFCAKLLKENNVNAAFTIVGSGSKYIWLKDEIAKYELGKYFILKGRHPLELMPSFYSEADAALVSLKPSGIFERTIPGKVQSYMLSALPILGMLDGEGRRLVDEAACGLSCSASDSTKLFENIKAMLSLSEVELKGLGLNGFRYAEKFFNKEKLITNLENILIESIRGK